MICFLTATLNISKKKLNYFFSYFFRHTEKTALTTSPQPLSKKQVEPTHEQGEAMNSP